MFIYAYYAALGALGVVLVYSGAGCNALENEAAYIALLATIAVLCGSGLLACLLMCVTKGACSLPRVLQHSIFVALLGGLAFHIATVCDGPIWPAASATAAAALFLFISAVVASASEGPTERSNNFGFESEQS